MDAVFFRPAKVEIFTVSDDNANGLAVVVVVAVEHIVVRSALIGPLRVRWIFRCG